MLFVVFSCFNLLQAYKLSNSFFLIFCSINFSQSWRKPTRPPIFVDHDYGLHGWWYRQPPTHDFHYPHCISFHFPPMIDRSSNHLFRSFLLIHSSQKESYRSKGCHHRSLVFSFSNISDQFSGLYVLKSLSNRVTLFFFFVLYQQYYLHMPMPMPMQTMIECVWLSLSTFLLCFACDAFMYCSPCKIHLLG